MGTVDLSIARIYASRLEEEYTDHKQACDRLATRIAEAKKKWDEEEQEIERDAHDPAWKGWLEYPPLDGYTALSSRDEISFPEPEKTESEDSRNEISYHDSDVSEFEYGDDDISLLEYLLDRGDFFRVEYSDFGSDDQSIYIFPIEEEEFPIPEVEENFSEGDE